MDLVILSLGMLAIAGAWDVGRRFADRNAAAQLVARVNGLDARVVAAESSRGDVEELREQVADMDRKLTSVSNATEAAKARRAPGWGR